MKTSVSKEKFMCPRRFFELCDGISSQKWKNSRNSSSFLPVQMGPRSNLLSKTINGRKSCNTVPLNMT